MSKISSIYDNLRTLVSTALGSGYRELTNPFDLQDNDELVLYKAWSVVPGPGRNTNRIIGCQKSSETEFGIPVVRLLTARDHDIDAKVAIIKELLEAQAVIFTEIEKDSDLGGTCAKAVHVAHSSVEYLEGDRDKYLLLVMSVTAEYLENLS